MYVDYPIQVQFIALVTLFSSINGGLWYTPRP